MTHSTRRTAAARRRGLPPGPVAALALVGALGTGCQDRQSSDAAFAEWVEEHAATIESIQPGSPLDDLEPLRQIVGDARVVTIGESLHGVREFLVLKHRMLEYLVTRLGFTALAMETGLPESKLVYDYVLGDTIPPASVRRDGFTWGFGEREETWRLIEWMRDHNDRANAGERVRFYGIDLTGGRARGFTDARAAIEGALTYVREVDPASALAFERTLVPLTIRATYDAFPALPTATRLAYAAAVDSLLDHFEARRTIYLRVSSETEFDWAHRQAIAIRQLLATFRAIPRTRPPPGTLLPDGAEREFSSRDRAMADNVGWVLEREGPTGRVVVFAHNVHVQRAAPRGSGAPRYATPPRTMGQYLADSLGPGVVVLASTYGRRYTGAGARALAERGTFGNTLSRVGLPHFLVDLRRAPAEGPVAAWMYAEQRYQSTRGFYVVRPVAAFDGVYYLDEIHLAQSPP